jgi:hypothetical protein
MIQVAQKFVPGDTSHKEKVANKLVAAMLLAAHHGTAGKNKSVMVNSYF